MPRLPLFLLLSALAACATTAATPATEAAPATTAAAPAGIPPGTYTVTLAAADVPANAPEEMRAGLVGPWEITMDGSGHALVRFNGRQVVDAPYQIAGQEITFGEDTGEYACHSPARYTWQASGGQLRFTRVEDTCAGRAVVLTTHPWTLRR